VISDPTAVFFVLAGCVALALQLEARTKLFGALGSALLGILLGMLLSNLGIIPGESPAYDFLRGPAVNAGIVLILLTVDVKSVAKAGPRMFAAFTLGGVGAALGASVAAFLLVGAIGEETWKLAGQYTATYTGGGVNFAAVGAALETSGELFTAGIAADVTMTAIWMATCLTVPVVFASFGKGREGARRTGGLHEDVPVHAGSVISEGHEGVGESGSAGMAPSRDQGDHEGPTLHQMLYSSVGTIELRDLALMAVIVLGTLGASDGLGAVLAPVPSVLFLTTIALLLAQIPAVKDLHGAGVMGNYLVLIFLASNGAMSVLANIVVYFAGMTVLIHGIVIFGLGRALGLDLKTLAVASQANVGGPASAMALATARGYADKLLPGVAVGLLGYAAGNYLGLAVAGVLRGFLGG